MSWLYNFSSKAIRAAILALSAALFLLAMPNPLQGQTTPFLISPYFGEESISQGYSAGHPAIDFGSLNYERVLAATGGTIAKVNWYNNNCHNSSTDQSCGYGLYIYVNHEAGYQTRYAHLSATAFNLTDVPTSQVIRGQVIGTGGNTGWSTGTHLHFEVRLNNPGVDPFNPSLWIDGQWANPSRPLPAPADGITLIVDDTADNSGGFSKGRGGPFNNSCPPGSCPYWTSAIAGYGNDMWRTNVNPTADYWARWMPTIPQQGIYEVWVHVPNANATTWQARYTIAHYDGQSTAVVDQAGLNNQWVSIGVYRFHGGNADNVYLTDLTGEGYRVHCYDAVGSALGQNYCQIGVDAVKFVRRAITYLPDVRNASGGWNSTILVRSNGGNAFVDVKFYDPFDGFLATQTNSNLAGQGVWEVPVGLSGFSGAVVVDASQDQAVIVENRYSGSGYGDGNAAVAYSAFDAGSATMYLPYAVYYPDAVTGGVPFVQYSRFTVQNTTTAAASLELTYINRGGVTDFTRTDTLLANGLRNYDLRYPGGAVPDLRETGYYGEQCDNILVGCNWTGAIKITSTNGQLITSVLTNYWRWYVAAYNGVSGGAQPVFAPSIERR